MDELNDKGQRVVTPTLVGRGTNGFKGSLYHPWPAWVLVVKGYHTKVRFPTDPDLFDHWSKDWMRENRIAVVADWREDARKDGWRP